jgi:hypothetical protein
MHFGETFALKREMLLGWNHDSLRQNHRERASGFEELSFAVSHKKRRSIHDGEKFRLVAAKQAVLER